MHGEGSLIVRLGTVLLVMATVVAAAVAALSTGVLKLPLLHHNSDRSQPVALAAQRTAGNQQWASAFCTNLLDWKKQIQRDGTSLDLGLGPAARIKDATAATTRMLRKLDQLGLPPAGQNGQSRAAAKHLRSDLQARALKLETDAASIASGDLAAIGNLLTDVKSDKAIGTQISNELQRVVSGEEGLSLAETSACRQLVGIPI
jgi:hypothetical protein